MDYVQIARELVYQMEHERGTGRTFILNHGVCNSDTNPVIVGFSHQHANIEIDNQIISTKPKYQTISLQDVENGALNGTRGPTILTHIVQENLLKELLKKITELEEINEELRLMSMPPIL